MIRLIKALCLALLTSTISWSTFANEIDVVKTNELIKKYNYKYERPKSCPMESKKFSDLLIKTDAIKDVLKGNCLQKENDKMSEVLESIKNIQEELKNNNLVTSQSSASESEVVTNLISSTLGIDSLSSSQSKSLSGIKFSKLFSNISTMFKKNQCSLDDGRVLEMTADLIYDTTQLGMISGNELGLIVAGGGFLVSSALRLIDLIFKQRFDFDKPIDRQTFIKLNCSFYEIRRELEIQGAFDIENNHSRQDYQDLKEQLENMALSIKKLELDRANLDKEFSEVDKASFEKNIGDLSQLKVNLTKIQKYLQTGLNQSTDIPTETQKLLMISKLSQDYEKLSTQIKFYKTLNLSSIPMLDDLFLQELKKFDSFDFISFQETMNISAKDFNEIHRAKLLFHVMRINEDISQKESSLSESNRKLKSSLALELDKKKEAYVSQFLVLKKVEQRLGSIVSPSEYSGLDDGSENMIAIIDNHKKISSQLYGEWGEKFLKFATYKSIEELKTFDERYELFLSKYKNLITGHDKDKLGTSYLCQDAQKLRIVYRLSDGLVQQGYDFIVTNKDIIYSDVKNYYNGNMNEEDNPSGNLGSVEKVQRHYKSALFALKKLKGEIVSQDDSSHYLEKQVFGSYYIGKSMIENSSAKAKIKNIQDIFEKNDCQKRLGEDLAI
jgi:hypothetical protein